MVRRARVAGGTHALPCPQMWEEVMGRPREARGTPAGPRGVARVVSRRLQAPVQSPPETAQGVD